MQCIVVTKHLLESQSIYEGLKRFNIDTICVRPQSLEGWYADTDALILMHEPAETFHETLLHFIENLAARTPIVFLFQATSAFQVMMKPFQERCLQLSDELELVSACDIIYEVLVETNDEYLEEIVSGPISLNRRLRHLEILGKHVQLTKKEFYLMELLTRNLGKPISRERIVDYVWDRRKYVASNTIDVYVSRLRKKLPKTSHSPIIKTIPCLGYQLTLNTTHD